MRQSSLRRIFAIIYLLMIPFGCIWMAWRAQLAQNRPPGSITVEQQVSGGGWILVLRFPLSSETWEEIFVRQESPNNPREIRRRAVDSIFLERLQPTNEQWQSVETIRRTWCENTPEFRNREDTEPFFDLGLRCTNALDRRHIQIPVDELPPELAYLIETVPSPTCDDPFCGWRGEVMK